MHKAAALTGTMTVCPEAHIAVVHIPAYFYSGELFLASSYLQQSKAFVHMYLHIVKDGETLTVTHHRNFAIDFTKHRINPCCHSPELCKTGNIIRKAHLQRIKLTVYSLVSDFSPTV